MKNKSFRINDDEISIFYYRIPGNISEDKIGSLISRLSTDEQKGLNAIINKDSRNQKLFGRIILNYITTNLGLNKPDYLHFTSSDKPEFESPYGYYFNISHSGNLVVCCITKDAQIGIDLELIKPVDFATYKTCFDSEEWQNITTSEKPEIAFLKLWVRKESVIKADGRGMEIELSSLNCLKSTAKTESETWYIQEIEIASDYLCSVACNKYRNVVLHDFDTVIHPEE